MVDFGGWDMPQQYTSIRDEHLAVRKAAGLFDVSHMGRLSIEGRHAEAFLNGVVTNDVAGVQPGHAQYNLMCREDGGIIDDLVIYKSSPTDFVVVVNASNREKDVAWLRAHLPGGVAMEDRTTEVSLIAFQGPRAEANQQHSGDPLFRLRQRRGRRRRGLYRTHRLHRRRRLRALRALEARR